MRPVAMMTPDLAMIAEVMLAVEGFREARILAKKTVTLYSLMTQQLSKQVQYQGHAVLLKLLLRCAGANLNAIMLSVASVGFSAGLRRR